ncbi:hypothetical protein AWN76_014420 [Rhodothermaceae bacterium RA]|nr:hypothetical protein AWN76_014420 [Rhodothermaceae bacterium RA]
MADLSAAERRMQTIQLLREHGHASVAKLSERFGVSEVTIRKDLRALEDEDVVVRTHGGAVLADHFKFDVPFDSQAALHAEEKRRIGQAAAARITDGDSLILTYGTTTAQVARHLLGRRNLTVLTNSVRILAELIGNLEADVLMLGGHLTQATATVAGPYAEQMLRDLTVRKLFLGCDGVDPDHGLTTTNALEAHLHRRMIDVAEEVIVVADASKFGRRGLSRVCDVDSIDVFITDARAPEAMVRQLETAGVEVCLV